MPTGTAPDTSSNWAALPGPRGCWKSAAALDDVRQVEILIDGEVSLGFAEIGLPRLDVAPLFPRYPAADLCGYAATVLLPGEMAGPHTLQVVATDGNGRSTDLAGIHLAITKREPTAS